MDQRKLDLVQAYDAGGACAYYGRRASSVMFRHDPELRKEYLRGYEEKPFGDKLYD